LPAYRPPAQSLYFLYKAAADIYTFFIANGLILVVVDRRPPYDDHPARPNGHLFIFAGKLWREPPTMMRALAYGPETIMLTRPARGRYSFAAVQDGPEIR
jgi:hypothetical protein